jgi:GNAT superfamily N-acetyltransferase
MFEIRPATQADVDEAIEALADAFAPDPLFHWFFEPSPAGVRASVKTFLSLLLRARIALHMPAFVLVEAGRVRGVVMGYATVRPVWPAMLADEWKRFEASVPRLADRFAAYDALSGTHEPNDAHYYLGVIGVHPSLQGQGAGKALIETFCAVSEKDERSAGVYLETAKASSLQFYLRNGFELAGEGRLGPVPLWCVFRRT